MLNSITHDAGIHRMTGDVLVSWHTHGSDRANMHHTRTNSSMYKPQEDPDAVGRLPVTATAMAAITLMLHI